MAVIAVVVSLAAITQAKGMEIVEQVCSAQSSVVSSEASYNGPFIIFPLINVHLVVPILLCICKRQVSEGEACGAWHLQSAGGPLPGVTAATERQSRNCTISD